MLKRIAFVLYLLAFIFVTSVFRSQAGAQYGSGLYGECPYGQSCPTQTPPSDGDGSGVGDDGQAGQETPPAETNYVSADVDNDGNLEYATDEDGNADNGYEVFSDPDKSSDDLLIVDGDNDGKADFFIDTNGDGEPDVYWDPDDGRISSVQVEEDEKGTAWIFTPSPGQPNQRYYVRLNTPVAPTADSRNRRLTSDNFGGKIYQSIGNLAAKVPPAVAYSFPYFLLLLLLILALGFIRQAQHE